MLATAAATVVSFELSIKPILESSSSGLELAVGLAYPIGELAIVTVVAAGLLLDGWDERGRVTLIGLGLLGLAVADTAFALDALDESYTSIFDPGWTLAFAGIAVATILPRSWPRIDVRVPVFAPSIVVSALLGSVAMLYALREIVLNGVQRPDSLALGVLLLLSASRAMAVARTQTRQHSALVTAQQALADAQTSRDRFFVELVNAQERSSRRIADLLHDDVVQQLTALGFRLELEAQKSELERLRELAGDTSEITTSIRRLLVELHPAILNSQGLGPAIDVAADDLRERGIDVRVSPFPHRLPLETETLAYRLVQEALANVQHSGALTAEVDLKIHDNTLRGRVSDSGSGVQPEESTAAGLGLLVARERVLLAGGRFLLDATREQGTDFVFELPLEASKSDADAEAVS